jgi:hypothetical protein
MNQIIPTIRISGSRKVMADPPPEEAIGAAIKTIGTQNPSSRVRLPGALSLRSSALVHRDDPGTGHRGV